MMNKANRLAISALSLLAVSSVSLADIRGEWKLYPSTDANPISVIDTPVKTYFITYGQPYMPQYEGYTNKDAFLFAYDKESDEVVSYHRMNYLSENLVGTAQYNPWGKYLLIGYLNGNIDLLYDDNTVKNIPALKNATVNSSKTINNVRFDSDNSKIYLATDFGFLVLDSENGKVLQSRIYLKSLNSIGRVGDKIIASDGSALYWASADNEVFSFSDFTLIPGTDGGTEIMPLSDNKFGYIKSQTVYLCEVNGDTFTEKSLFGGATKKPTYNRDGYVLHLYGTQFRMLDREGNSTVADGVPGGSWNDVGGSWNGEEFWQLSPRKGMSSYTYSAGTWTATRTGLRANAPSPYVCSYMQYTPKYGVVVINHGVTSLFPRYEVNQPPLPAALKDGTWTNYGYPYTNETYAKSLYNPAGVAVDPENEDYIYYGSFMNGLQRMNLADPQDVRQLTHTSDAATSLPGVIPYYQDLAAWSVYCNVSPISFDGDGYMWWIYDTFIEGETEVYVWSPEDRANFNTSAIGKFKLKGTRAQMDMQILPLRSSANRNKVLLYNGTYDREFILFDHNGTRTDTSDDTQVLINSIVDQDGNKIEPNRVYAMYEDTSTGLVWVGAANGVFTINPVTSMTQPQRVNRIKVSRSDGTNLADYLLDNVPVFKITSDGSGRKWFGTGGGIVVTSADGKNIEAEMNVSNSEIPDNTVYSVCYNPQANSMMVGTMHGLAEFYINSQGSGSGDSDSSTLRIYPNPVRPDYLGWVTIDNLPENAIVKIVDSAGNLVKELGFAENGMVRWDVTNSNLKRVRSGVYHVFASSGPDTENVSAKGKILVVN